MALVSWVVDFCIAICLQGEPWGGRVYRRPERKPESTIKYIYYGHEAASILKEMSYF